MSGDAGDHLQRTVKMLSKINGEVANYEEDARPIRFCCLGCALLSG